MPVRFARSARKHRISRLSVLAAMESAGDPVRIPARPGEGDDRWLWIGLDGSGVEIEVLAVMLGPDDLLVIHAMPTAWRNRGRSE